MRKLLTIYGRPSLNSKEGAGSPGAPLRDQFQPITSPSGKSDGLDLYHS